MSEFNVPAVNTATTTIDISLAELAGANSGQRPDLLARPQAIYRVPDGTLYTSNEKQLVLADNLPIMGKRNPLTGGIVNSIWNGTQAQYDAIVAKDANTVYMVA